MATSKKEQQEKYPTQLLTDQQFKQLLDRMPRPQQQPSALGKLLSGTANAAGKLVSVHGKKLSLEGKIIRKDLYIEQGMTAMVNPLGIEIERPMQLYSIPRPPVASSAQLRQKLSYFGVNKLRVF